jgi:hypothetical protein
MFLPTPTAPLRIVVVAAALAVTSWRSTPADSTPAVVPSASACGESESCRAAVASAQQQALGQARRAAERAARDLNTNREIDDWAECARDASRAIDAAGKLGLDAATLGTACTDEFLRLALHEGRRWSAGTTRIGGLKVDIEFRNLSPSLQGQVGLIRASDVPMNVFAGKRYARAGYGIPLVAQSARCRSGPVCDLLPREGVFRGATAWIESLPADAHADLRLVVADPLRETLLRAGDHRYALALDTSAAYAVGANSSALRRLGVYGLLGGDEIGRRAGVYLLEDYDPNKRPIVMIHGLAASPLNFARISNAIWGDPQLRARFQVWHVIYQTDAPLMILRRRVQDYLDRVWSAGRSRRRRSRASWHCADRSQHGRHHCAVPLRRERRCDVEHRVHRAAGANARQAGGRGGDRRGVVHAPVSGCHAGDLPGVATPRLAGR